MVHFFNTPTRICKGTEPQCRKMVGTLNYIKVEDCQSEQQIEINYCEVRYYKHTHSHSHSLLCCVFYVLFLLMCFCVYLGQMSQQVHVLPGTARCGTGMRVLCCFTDGAHRRPSPVCKWHSQSSHRPVSHRMRLSFQTLCVEREGEKKGENDRRRGRVQVKQKRV